MSAITNMWRQLVQRRLWPVAILLIAALAAVPLALAKDAEPPAPAPPAPSTDSGETALATEAIVAKATAADRAKRRKVLGTAKNPFGLPPEEEAGSAAAPNSDGAVVTKTDTGDDSGSQSGSGSGGDSSSGGSPGTPSAPATPAPAPKTYALHELTVRFGSADGSKRQSVKRLQPLPSAELPVLIYMGVLKDGKTAVFLVDHGVTPVGDGECKPTPEDCETIRLQAGETEFLDVKDETGAVVDQYQLDLIKIHKSSTASASKAKAGSNAGARLLKARVSSDGPTAYRWNSATGTLEQRRTELRSVVGRVSAELP